MMMDKDPSCQGKAQRWLPGNEDDAKTWGLGIVAKSVPGRDWHVPCSGRERWHNRDRVGPCGCHMEERDGEGEQARKTCTSLWHEGTVHAVKVLLSILGTNGWEGGS